MKKYAITIVSALAAVAAVTGADFTHGLPRVSVACMRAEPRHAAELVSQAVMGTPLRLIEESRGGWWRVATPEGYEGWVIGNSLTLLSPGDYEAWLAAPRVLLASPDPCFVLADTVSRERVSDTVSGIILEGTPSAGRYTAVKLPDGRRGYLPTAALMPLERWAETPFEAARLPEIAARYMGTPYLWGGTSDKSMDCSGLTRVCAYEMGVLLPRDASQQAREGSPVLAPAGEPLTDEQIALLEPGDLLFFGNKRAGRVNHVAIYRGDGRFIHASGRVKVNSLRPDDEDYAPLALLSARRLTPGNTRRFRPDYTTP